MCDFLIHYIDNATEYIPDFTKIKTKTKKLLVDIENKKIYTQDKQTYGYLIRKEVIFTQCTKI